MRRFALVSILFLAVAGAAMAQSRAPAVPDPKAVAPDPKACAPAERMPAPGANATTGENLTDKLARTDGVICPPEVDPHINAPTPDTGKTPVIPPPGSPGGNPNVRPK